MKSKLTLDFNGQCHTKSYILCIKFKPKILRDSISMCSVEEIQPENREWIECRLQMWQTNPFQLQLPKQQITIFSVLF